VNFRTKRYMRTLLIFVVMFLAGSLLSRGQPVPAAESPMPARTYHLLREDDDWSFLRDPALRQDFWDPLKYIPLRRDSPDWYLTISGEARQVWEQTGNNNWGEQPYWNSFFLERYSWVSTRTTASIFEPSSNSRVVLNLSE
jgi:hypothetical protein